MEQAPSGLRSALASSLTIPSSSPERDLYFKFTSGPRDAQILLVGEAWGATEAQLRLPFVGYSGRELFRMLGEAGFGDSTLLKHALATPSSSEWLRLRELYLKSASILLANVVSEQPPGNDFTHFLYPTKEKPRNVTEYHGIYPKPSLLAGISSLWNLISTLRPKLIIAAGNWPLHILTEHADVETVRGYKLPTAITKWRGSQTYSRPLGSEVIPVLPIIHPASITRAWYLRAVTVHDLRARAGRFIRSVSPWTPPPASSIFRPSLIDVERHLNLWIAKASITPLRLTVDIETYQRRFIACIGLGTSKQQLCIPFFYFNAEGVNIPYWSLEDELYIWMRLRSLLEHPNIEIVGQNFMYDSLFLAYYGIDCTVTHDTMVKYHLLYPGTPKALHYISSLFCDNYCFWKEESEEWAAGELGAEALWQYNCKDIAYTDECNEELTILIEKAGRQEHLRWRMREWRLARKMALRGVRDDNNLRQLYKQDLAKQSAKLQGWLLNAVPDGWRYGGKDTPWYNSPKATMALLYDLVGTPPILHKKTKRPTSDDEAIEELLQRKELLWLEPLLKRLQAMRSLNVFRSHHLDITMGPGGRYVTQYNITGTETFRWSSGANPLGEGSNAQNLPKVQIDET